VDAYWPAAALPKLCSFDASKVLVAMVQGESRVGPLVYSKGLCVLVGWWLVGLWRTPLPSASKFRVQHESCSRDRRSDYLGRLVHAHVTTYPL
jgi:hypothetical protein